MQPNAVTLSYPATLEPIDIDDVRFRAEFMSDERIPQGHSIATSTGITAYECRRN